MTSKCLWRVALIGTLAVALCANAEADSLKTSADKFLVLAIVGVAVVVTVIVVAVHETTKKRTITGCVRSSQNGMTVTDEKGKQIYALSGDNTGVKPGEQMTLQGKKIKPNGTNPLIWETKKLIKDFGLCQP